MWQKILLSIILIIYASPLLAGAPPTYPPPSDEAYNATTWNGITGIAPSKNAVRDKIETLAPSTGSTSIVSYGPTALQSASCTANALTLTPTAGLGIVNISVTQTGDANCIITMGETGAVEGTIAIIKNISDGAAETLTFTTSSGVLRLIQGSSYVMAINETLILQYKGSEWLEIGRSSGTINIGTINLPSSDADPGTTAGNIRHDSTDTGSNSGGTAKWYDGAQVRSLVDTGTNYTIITKTEYIPIAYAEDGAAAPAAATVWADTRKAKIRVFAADADDDVEIHWVVPNDYVGGIKFRAIGFVDNATAPADTETVIMNLAGCSVGDSDDGGCTLGTGVNATFTANATYAQHDRWSTAWSNEITVTDIAAGESVMLKLFRDVDDTYGQGIGVAGIEIKYKAKIIGIGGY